MFSISLNIAQDIFRRQLPRGERFRLGLQAGIQQERVRVAQRRQQEEEEAYQKTLIPNNTNENGKNVNTTGMNTNGRKERGGRRKRKTHRKSHRRRSHRRKSHRKHK